MRSFFRVLFVSLLTLGLILNLSCGGGNPSQTDAPIALLQRSIDSESDLRSIQFRHEDGSEVFSLQILTDGAKVESADGSEIVRLTVDESDKVKIKDPQDTTLGYVVTNSDNWKLKDADQTQDLFILRRRSNGDYRLETGADQELHRIKHRDYGFEIQSPQEVTLYKVKLKEDKLSLRDADEETIFYTRDPLAVPALTPFGFEVLSREQQMGLSYAIDRIGE